MIVASMRYRIHDVNQVYVNLNDILQMLQDGEDDTEFRDPTVARTLEKVEEIFLQLGIYALVNSSNEALDRIKKIL
jgi:hypothetical protein